MFNKIYIVSKIGAEDTNPVRSVVLEIRHAVPMLSFTTKREITIVEDSRDITPDTLIIAVGGDGTMLEAMRISAVSGAVAMGINLGKVGFLTDFISQKHVPSMLHDIFNGKDNFSIEERTSLTIDSTGTTDNESVDPIVTHRLPIAFNEFALAHRDSDSMLRYNLRIDRMNAGYHRANSLVVSTPTGSTAYSLSAGGSLIIPDLNVIQLTPVAPPTLTSRPIIVGGSSTIVVDAETNGGLVLRADGRIIREWKQKARVTFISHQLRAKILHTPDWNFFMMLTKKLGWQQNH